MTTSDTSYYILYEFYTLYIHGNIHDNLESGVDAVGKKKIFYFLIMDNVILDTYIIDI